MADRVKLIYQNFDLFAGPTPSTGFHLSVNGSGINSPNDYDTSFGGPHSGFSLDNSLKHLTRVQTLDHEWSITRTDINQNGQLAALDRAIIESPDVSLSFSYYTTNGVNEKRLGFITDNTSSMISNLLNKTEDDKNYFILISPEGEDAIGNLNTGSHSVVAIGNGFISDFSVEAAVGGLSTSSVTIEALNQRADIESSGNSLPAVNPEDGVRITGRQYVVPFSSGSEAGQPTALRPGDITLELYSPFGARVSGVGKAHIQSFNLSVPIARETVDRLGSDFSFSREITFPVTVTLSVNALATELRAGGLDSLICSDTSSNLIITMREPACGVAGPIASRYELKNAKIDSQSFGQSIGDNATYDITYSAQIAASGDNENGLFYSGSYTGN